MKAMMGLTLLSLCLVSMAGTLDAQKQKTKSQVRELKFKPADPTAIFNIGGQSKIIRLADAAAVEKLVGPAAAQQLLKQVDFKTEAIAFVSWTTSGPPEGMLKHEVKADGTVQFYVQGPIGATIRGGRARLGADFFAVPANAKVAFDVKER
jgi:hypothetical protein